MTKLFSHYRILAFNIWLLAVVCSLAWNTLDNIREHDSIAHETARAFYKQILAARQWNLLHGGVYVYTTEHSPPNLYLPEDKQTILDSNGRSMTLINPAYMTRQIAEINEEKGPIQFHITSLTPLRDENAPYPWEIPWLQSFDRGEREQGESGLFYYRSDVILCCICCRRADWNI